MTKLVMRSRPVRGVTFVLIAAQLVYAVPVVAQRPETRASQTPSSVAPRPPNVRANRAVPDVEPPAVTLQLSPRPTRDEIFRARVFTEPVVPIGGEPTDDDSAALGQALRAFHGRSDRRSTASIETYLANRPDSPWRASLLANLGHAYRNIGAFSRAMDTWEEAWQLTKDSVEPQGRAVADLAISHWLEVAAMFGQAEVVRKRIDELAGRDVRGGAGARVAAARETAALLMTYPDEVIASGPEALRVLLSEAGISEAPAAITGYRSSAAGTSLAEVAALARGVGLSLRPAKWTGVGEIPVPAVLHWKLGHFSPIVERQGDQYRIIDVALGGTLWVSGSTLATEASGYFMVPEGAPAGPWQGVSDAQAGVVIGHSCLSGGPHSPSPSVGGGSRPPRTSGPAVGGGSPGRAGGGESQRSRLGAGCNGGMCGVILEPSSISLQLSDTPLGYTPPRGPVVNFWLTYQQREMLQPQTFTYAHVGPMWSFEWQRYLEEHPALGTPAHVSVYHAGGFEQYYPSGGAYGRHWKSRATVVLVSSSPLRYERRFPDGSIEVYAVPDAAPTGERRVFISEMIDPQGQALQFTWDAQFRLVAVTDAIGQVTTLAYDDGEDALRLTSVTDPFGREATLQYTSEGQLASITDVIGITSAFTYAKGDFVAQLKTPYGTSTFRREDASWEDYFSRAIQATDPLGETEYLRTLWKATTLPATLPASEVPTGFEGKNRNLNYYHTFYWNKQAFKTASDDVTKAVHTRWFLKSLYPGLQERMAVPHSIKLPLEGRVWFMYPGQGATSDKIDWYQEPSHIGRRMDDGSSQVSEYTYDTFGNLLTATDPLGRRTTYVYASNGVDLLEVRQTTGTQNDLLASFSNYTAQHRPQTIIDTSGGTTTVTYNGAGQPLTITNPNTETTTLAYNTDGQLLSIDGPGTGDTASYTYDTYGRVRTHTNVDGDTTTTDYDAFDRVTRVTYPDSTFEAYTYDRLDVATVRDRLGRVTRVFHDALRRVVGVRDPLGRTVQQTWGADGTLDTLTDAKRQATTWEYDLQGRVTREVRADASDTVYTYEALAGRLKTVTDPMGQVKTYGYALDDAITSVVYTNATIATPSVSYTYDTLYPRLATMGDGLGTTSYAYRTVGQSGAGNLASVDGPRTNDTLTYTYDALARQTSRALNAVGATWTYDALSRITSEVNLLGTFTYTYDAASARPASATYPNGQTTTYSYLGSTNDRRLQTLHHRVSGGATLSKFDYTYDVVGNILSWQQQADAAAPTQWTYGYDLADQLVSAKKTTDPTPTVMARYGYVYDMAGNRTTEQIDDALTGGTVNALNRLVSHQPSGTIRVTGGLNEAATVTINGKAAAVDASYSFTGTASVASGANAFTVLATDPAGNSEAQIYDLTSSGSTKTFTYDANGNLTTDGTRTFEWDVENRLVAVNVGAHRSEFTYDGESHRTRIVEKEGGVTVRDAQLFWDAGEAIEERLSTGEINRFFQDGESHNGSARYLSRDHLGSVREVTGAAGAVVTRNDYDPYGQLTRIAGTEDSRFGFTGHYVHGPSGLALTLYRAYDAGLGRWLSEDPSRFVDGPNVYAYVGSNPLARVDRFGLQHDSVTRSLMEAIRHGNVAEVRNILEVSKDVLTAEWKTAGREAIQKLETPARDLIRASVKRSKSYASELEEETFEALIKNGGPKASKMVKLIKEGGRLSDKVKSCFR